MDDWTDVTNAVPTTAHDAAASPLQYLIGFMAEADASKVIQVAGIDTMQDLTLLENEETRTEVVKEAGLKIIPAKKLSQAIQALVRNVQHNDSEANDGNAKASLEQKPTTKNSVSKLSMGKPDECVVVAIDRSGSMGCGLSEAKAFGLNAEKTLVERSRMDAVKQCFYAFRDRTESLGAHHNLGLLQFDDAIEELLPLTSNLDKFESVVDEMKQRGMTAIYSAISHACDMLGPFDDPQTDLRILVLTDGRNNAGISSQSALRKVLSIGAVVDAIVVGEVPDANLRKIVSASGGCCFQVNSLSDGFELMEAESVVSLRSRRGGADKADTKSTKVMEALLAQFDGIEVKALTAASQAAMVSTAPVKENNGPVKFVPCSAIAGDAYDSNVMQRIVKELKDFTNNSIEGVHIYANENDLHEWVILLEGPRGTPYEQGVFCLDISFPVNYPFKPPRITFRTPIFHCNVSASGGICLDILQDQWSPGLTVPKCLRSILCLLQDPNSDDALRPAIADLFFAHRQSGGTDTRYMDQATASTRGEANKSVSEWQALLHIVESSP